MPAIRAQNGAPMLKIGMPATVTRNVTSAPEREAALEGDGERALQHAQHGEARERGDEGRRRRQHQARHQRREQAEADAERRRPRRRRCIGRALSPPAEMMALTGPVRQVGTAPTKAATDRGRRRSRPRWLSMGGVWPAAVSTANALAVLHHQHGDRQRHHQLGHGRPGELRQVQARGGQHAGRIEHGRDRSRHSAEQRAPTPRRRSAAAGAPPAGGTALTARNAAVMAAAIHRSAWKARTQSRPKARNTPATMPITIGIGTACMARCTQPATPSASISRPVAM